MDVSLIQDQGVKDRIREAEEFMDPSELASMLMMHTYLNGIGTND